MKSILGLWASENSLTTPPRPIGRRHPNEALLDPPMMDIGVPTAHYSHFNHCLMHTTESLDGV